jgi:hypothetical protein
VYTGDMVSVDGVSGCSCVGDDVGYRPIVHSSSVSVYSIMSLSEVGLSCPYSLCAPVIVMMVVVETLMIQVFFLIETYSLKESCKYR